MTITVPKWVLLAVGAATVAVVAFLLGKGTGDDQPRGPVANATTPPEPLACSQDVAEQVAGRSEFGREYEASGASLEDFFEIRLEGCTDLNGDGLDEMVVRLHGGTGSAIGPVTIFSQEDGNWRPQIDRVLSNNDIAKVTDAGVREVTAAYGPSEPACCPSGQRSGLTRWNGSRFVYEPDAGIGDGRISLSDSAVVSIGPFEVQTGSLVEAIDALGIPSSYDRSGELCEATWKDTGLTINLVDLGGANPCGSSGAVGSAIVFGDQAEQVGWTVGNGLQVGSTQDEIRSQYPRMKPMPMYSAAEEQIPPGRNWSLVTRPSLVGRGDRTVSLAMRLDRGHAVAYAAYVGAGGE
jgi:hypothetical protein